MKYDLIEAKGQYALILRGEHMTHVTEAVAAHDIGTDHAPAAFIFLNTSSLRK